MHSTCDPSQENGVAVSACGRGWLATGCALVIAQGDRIGKYVIERAVGSPGGQGTVFLARDDRGRQYALKVPHEVGPRFLRELDAARAVISPHVARVWDFDLHHDPPHIAYQAVPGEPLDRVLTERGLEPLELLRIFRQVALGLADIHAVSTAAIPQLTHGDLSLDNILVTDQNDAVIIDLGAARTGNDSSISREVFGKFGYFAPEQLKGQAVGPPADVWQLAICVLRAATGRMPFGSGPASVPRILDDPPNAVDAEWVVVGRALRGLDKDPERRPSAAELAEDLAEWESRHLRRRSPWRDGRLRRVHGISFRVKEDGLIIRRADVGTSEDGDDFFVECARDVRIGDQILWSESSTSFGPMQVAKQLQVLPRQEVPGPVVCPDCGTPLLPLLGNWRWREPDQYLGPDVEDAFCPAGETCERQREADHARFFRRLVFRRIGPGWADEDLHTFLLGLSSPQRTLTLRRDDFKVAGLDGLWPAYQEWRDGLGTQLSLDVSELCEAFGAPGHVFATGLVETVVSGAPWDPGFGPTDAQCAWWKERGAAVIECARTLTSNSRGTGTAEAR